MNADKSVLDTLNTIVMSDRQRERAEQLMRTSSAVIEMIFGVAQRVGLGAPRSK